METLKRFSLKSENSDFKKVEITRSQHAYGLIRGFYFDDIEIYESMFILLVNSANMTIGYAKISQGGVSGTVVDLKIIAKYAIESLATGVILAHNHPSGKTEPSKQDVDITHKVNEALKLLDIVLLDHLIIASYNYTSMKEKGYF